jgi:hypothetical protein
MEFGKIIMDLEDALYAEREELKKDAARLDWLIENNKISFDCEKREDIDAVMKISEHIDNLKPESPENN